MISYITIYWFKEISTFLHFQKKCGLCANCHFILACRDIISIESDERRILFYANESDLEQENVVIKKSLLKRYFWYSHFLFQIFLFYNLVSTIVIFLLNDSPSDSETTKKCFLFHLKSSFSSRDIQIFVIFPFFLKLSKFKRTNESGTGYYVMSCLV